MSPIILPRHEVKDKISTSVTSSWNSHSRYGLLWVYGPAGVGKTTIIRSVAESLLQKPKDPPTYVLAQPVNPLPQILGACLFLSRENPVADSRQLFADLAHDLAHRYSKLAPFIQYAFDTTPGMDDLSLEQQCDSLLVDPIRTWAQDITEDHQVVVFVDGLDACDGGKSEHLKIIDAIHQSFQSLTIDHVKWQWIISSRSEPWIYSTFNELSSDPRVQNISVPLASQQEIGDYIDHSLKGIAGRSGRLDNIRWHSAGYFAYAASLVAYVDLPTAGRSVRFRNVVTHAEHASFKHEHTHMFTQLDEMYNDILVRVPLHLRDLTKRVLGAISVTQPSSWGESNPTALMLSKLLGISVEEIHDALYHLHSVITAGQDFTIPGLTFYHKSFNDFLRNPSRSRDWCIDLLAVHAGLAKCCLKQLSVKADENSPAYQYATKFWFVHCWRAGANPDAPNNMELELDILSELNKFDYSLLPRDQLVDRYFVEWLLWLQEFTTPKHPVLNPGPRHSLWSPGHHSISYSSYQQRSAARSRKLPPTPTYVLGLEPSNQVLLVPVLELKGDRSNNAHIEVLGPKEKKWDWICGFKVVSLAETTRNIEDDDTWTTGEEHQEDSGGVGGGWDYYDELVAKSLAWEEENGGFDETIYGGFVSTEEEMIALIAALDSTEENPLRVDAMPNEEVTEGDAPNDVVMEVAAAVEDNGIALLTQELVNNPASGEARGLEDDGANDSDTEVYSSARSSIVDLAEMVGVAPQARADDEVGIDGDFEFEIIDYEEAIH